MQSLYDRLVGGPSGFRELLLKLGPTFIKIGQFLALRPDLVPQDYCDELMKLLDQVPPFPWSEAKRILIEDLGKDPAELFAYVNPRPVAAGSLAQTHLARLKDGTEIALKIQRPNIKQRVLVDLRRGRALARLLDLSRISLIASPRDVVQEITEWMMQEIDFRNELENMTRLHQLSGGLAEQRIPRPYPELSSARVITAEFLRGVPMSEILGAVRTGTAESQDRLSAIGVDRDRLAANLFNAVLNQIFRYQFFHADLHPGNLIALPGNVIGFVDFGLCAHIDETIREKQLRYMAAAYSGETESMFSALLEILVPGEMTDVDAFRREFYEETSAWNVKRSSSDYATDDAKRGRSATGEYLISIMRSAKRNQLKVPTRVLAMYRALLTAEAVADQLRDRLDLRGVGRHFFGKLQLDEVVGTLELKNLQPIFLSLFTLLRDSPRQLEQVLSSLAAGRLSVNVEVSEARNGARASRQRTRTVVAAIMSVGIAVMLSSGQLSAELGAPVRWCLWSILIYLYIYIAFQCRNLK